MLVLSRQQDERIVLTNGSDTIVVVVCKVDNVNARLGFDAPANWRILREELLESPQSSKGGTDANEVHAMPNS